MMNLHSLDKYSIRIYSDLLYACSATEGYRIRDILAYGQQHRIDHDEPSQEERAYWQTACLGNRGSDDRGSCSGLQCQQTDHLPGDPQWQAQSLSAQQRLPDQTRRFAGLVREFSCDAERQGRDGRRVGIHDVYLACTSAIHDDSASPVLGRYIEADAAMDLPSHKYSSCRPRWQRRWTARPSETPGLPSWAAGNGSGYAPSPSEIWCILRRLTSVSGCLSARSTGCSMGIGG